MLKKDYILRQFEEFGKVMAVIFGYKKNNDWVRFELEIEKALNTFTSFEINDLIVRDQESFESFISKNTQLKPDQIKIMADLLYERSFISENKKNDNEMKSILKKANFLYELYSNTLTANEYNLEVRYRIDRIKKIILPPNLL